MRVIQEKEILKLRRNKKISGEDGKKVKLRSSPKKPKALSVEDHQSQINKKVIQSFDKIVTKVDSLLQLDDKNTAVLLGLIGELKNIKMLEFPEPVKKWRFDVSRDRQGFIEEITAERKEQP